jgi:hypothetical protein
MRVPEKRAIAPLDSDGNRHPLPLQHSASS